MNRTSFYRQTHSVKRCNVSSRRGLTLIELLLVLSVVGLVVSMAAVNYSKSMDDFRDLQCLNRIKDLDEKGRQMAFSVGRPTSLKIDGIRGRADLKNSDGITVASAHWTANKLISLHLENENTPAVDILEIVFSPQGFSVPYAIKVRSRQNRLIQKEALFFYGTGQTSDLKKPVQKKPNRSNR